MKIFALTVPFSLLPYSHSFSVRNQGNTDTLFTVMFVQLQLTVSVNIVIIIAPKFYLVSSFSSNNQSSFSSAGIGREQQKKPCTGRPARPGASGPQRSGPRPGRC